MISKKVLCEALELLTERVETLEAKVYKLEHNKKGKAVDAVKGRRGRPRKGANATN